MIRDIRPLSYYDDCIATGLNYTHVIQQPSYQRRLNLSEVMNDFWPSYCQTVNEQREGEEQSSHLWYAEKHPEYAPINITVMLKYDDDRYPFSDQFIGWLVSVAQKTISEVYELSDNGINMQTYKLICIVLTGTDPHHNEAGNSCYSISLRFPTCVTSVESQNNIFRNRLINAFNKNNIFSYIPTPIDTNLGNIVMPLTQDLPMYGSISPQFPIPYEHHYTFDYIPFEHFTQAINFNPLDYTVTLEGLNYFDPNLHQDCQRYNFNPLHYNNNYDFWMPMILSVHFNQSRTRVKITDSPTSNAQPPTQLTQAERDTDVFIAEVLLSMIKKHDEETWRYVIGKALYNCWRNPIFNEERTLFNADSSRYQEKAKSLWFRYLTVHGYSTAGVDYEWESFVDNNYYTLRSIAWLAMKDSPREYETWFGNWIAPSIKLAIETCKQNDHYRTAEAIYRCFWLDLALATNTDNQQVKWFKYTSHRWIAITELELDHYFRVFRSRIEHVVQSYTQIMQMTTDQNEKDLINNRISLAALMYRKFGEVRWCSNIKHAIRQYFHIRDFGKLLDANVKITGVGNGVIEVNDKRAIFRDGMPEDYISKFTEVRYRDDYHNDHPDVKAYMDWLGQVFPDPELRLSMLRFNASLLHGIVDKKAYIWTGEGDNAKSTYVMLLTTTLGTDYVVVLPPTFLTVKQGSSSAASPDIASTNGARLVVTSEPEEGESIKSGRLKTASSGDQVRARKLYDNGSQNNQTYKLVVQCNEIPDIKKERATINRAVIVPFLSTWMDERDMPSPEECRRRNIYKKDIRFISNIHMFSAACLYMMVQYFPAYISNPNHDVPRVVKEHTQQYWNRVDDFYRFFCDCVEYAYADGLEPKYYDVNNKTLKDPNRPLDMNSYIGAFDMSQQFIQWYRMTGRLDRAKQQKTSIPTHDRIIEELTRYLGPVAYGGWLGVRFSSMLTGGNALMG